MLERRFLHRLELRASQGDEGSMIISGYAARFGIISEPLENFREVLQKNCFSRSLASGSDVRCNYQHLQEAMLGRTKNKSLTLAEDDKGLRFRCVLPDTQGAKDVYSLITRRDISDCSFEFSVDGEDGETWSEVADPDDRTKRVALRSISQPRRSRRRRVQDRVPV